MSPIPCADRSLYALQSQSTNNLQIPGTPNQRGCAAQHDTSMGRSHTLRYLLPLELRPRVERLPNLGRRSAPNLRLSIDLKGALLARLCEPTLDLLPQRWRGNYVRIFHRPTASQTTLFKRSHRFVLSEWPCWSKVSPARPCPQACLRCQRRFALPDGGR